MKNLSRQALVLAWASMLFLSVLPDVIYRELTGEANEWLLLGKLVLLTVLLWLSLFWEPARKLRRFYLVFIALLAADEMFSRLDQWDQWQLWFSGKGFAWGLLGVQVRRVGTGLALILALLGLGFRRPDFFLRVGELDAPAAPMPVFGFDRASSWRRLGRRLAIYIGLATLIVLWLLGRPSLEAFQRLLPLLPAILGLAAMNSFGEEIAFRAALLAPTHKVLGANHAILLSAGYFGISHYYGLPYGLIGVLLAAFFGWVLGRAMLESKGLFWPWLIHMVADVAIFSFMAMGALAPGGP